MPQTRRIVLNVLATYGRSLYSLALGLFTARWALQALGAENYGLCGVVGGMVAFIVYFNSILGSSIGRYFALSVGEASVAGEKGLENCRMWFTTAVMLHTVIPVALLAIGYPTGLWAVEHFLTIPADRIGDCIWIWRFACVTCFLNMVSVPFLSMYMAKQCIAELTVYSFATSTLNAVFLYVMVTHPGEWLVRYAAWQCLISLVPQVLIAGRALVAFPECRFQMCHAFNLSNVRKLCGYAFWNAWGTLGAVLRTQGAAVLVNKAYGPQVNAGMAIGTNLSAQSDMLAGSLTGAFSPAIFNAWGAGDRRQAMKLAICVCRFGTLLVLLFAVPLAVEVDLVLKLWLKDPPAYANGFCLCILAMTAVDKLAFGHMIVVNANGKVALYQSVLGTVIVLTLPLALLLMWLGGGVYSVGYAMVLTMTVCVTGRVLMARWLVGMDFWGWLLRTVTPIALVAALSCLAGLVSRSLLDASFLRLVVSTAACEAVLLPLSWFVVLNREEKTYCREKIASVRGKFARRME